MKLYKVTLFGSNYMIWSNPPPPPLNFYQRKIINIPKIQSKIMSKIR